MSSPKGYKPFYRTPYGAAFFGDSLKIMEIIPKEIFNLILTSPPFALRTKKEYGNVTSEEYIEWFRPFAKQIFRILKPSGSFVLEIGGVWEKGKPIRSLYQFELLLDLCKNVKFNLAQEFFWFNSTKMPVPTEWVSVKRIRVKDAVHYIFWLAKSIFPKASNQKILNPYSESMKELLRRGSWKGKSPSGHRKTKHWEQDRGGAIPSNLIIALHGRSRSPYLEACKEQEEKPHPARFVQAIPEFFIKFLTDPGDLILDPFAGSNMTGYIAEKLERK